MLEVSFLSLFLAGLLGGVHCVGMCGGLVSALSLQLPPARARWPFLLTYNLARLGSYALAGMLAGLAGSASGLFQHLLPVSLALYLLASLLLIGLGLYLAGLSNAISWLERPGRRLWRHLNPLLTKLLPVRSLGQAWLVGMLWGWLPCGLVYTALVSALASGTPLKGASIMLCFGAGTLPNLLAMGAAAQKLSTFTRKPLVRKIAGLTVAGFGLVGVARVVLASMSAA